MTRARLTVAMGSVYPYDESHVRGGIEAVALYLARALARRDDIDLHVVSCTYGLKDDVTEQRGSITVHWLASRRRLHALRALTVDICRVRDVYDLIRPDVVHAQGFSEYALAARNTTMVLSIHGVEPLVPSARNMVHFKGVAGHYRRWAAVLAARESIRKADAIIDNAGGYALQPVNSWLKGKRICRIANPVAETFFRLPQSGPLASEEPLVIWVGEIGERKNVLDLLQAFALVVLRVPQSHLLLIGGSADLRYLDRVRSAITEHGLGDKVTLAGRIGQSELMAAYAKASILAMTSLEETAPMALAQAMAAGKPVVATRVGGIPWIIEDGVSGYLVNVGDVRGLSDKIAELLCNESLLSQMGGEARKKAQEHFAPDAVCHETVRLYYQMLGRDN